MALGGRVVTRAAVCLGHQGAVEAASIFYASILGVSVVESFVPLQDMRLVRLADNVHALVVITHLLLEIIRVGT